MKKNKNSQSGSPGTKEHFNRRASFEVAVEDTYEAGIILTGDEIKSIRADRVSLQGSFIRVLGGGKAEAVPRLAIVGMQITEGQDPHRSRPLLLHTKEIREIAEKIRIKGQTAVPLKLYFKRGWAKVLVGIGPGRRRYDKRELLRKRDLERQQAADLRGKQHGKRTV